MRRTFMYFALAAALLSGCKKESPPGAVKLVVEYQGFRPECIRVTAWDADAPERRESRPVRPKAVSGPLQSTDKRGEVTVAVFRAPAWGHTLQMSAEGFERGACDAEGLPLAGHEPVAVVESGRVVTRDGEAGAPVTLTLTATDADGDGYVAASGGAGGTDCNDASAAAYPGATEVCDGIDNNCDGNEDEGFKVGQACAEDNACGTWACREDGTAFCDGPPPTVFYLDADGDGFGGSTSVSACQQPDTGNYTTEGGDCDDTRDYIKPGAAEVCDGYDNDCNGTVDDVPGLDDSCEAEGICNGKLKCDLEKGDLVCTGDAAQKFYRDLDDDGYGSDKAEDVKYSCTGVSPDPLYIEVAGDCDDGDKFTYSGASEICDGRDNDCDGVEDNEGVCTAGNAHFASVTIDGSNDVNWRSVVTYDGTGVWMVGSKGNLAVKKPELSTFTRATCGGNGATWYAVWVAPDESTHAFIGGDGKRLALIPKDASSGCLPAAGVESNFTTYGFALFEADHLLGVGAVDGSRGATFDWNGGTGDTVPLSSASYVPLRDIHGVSLDVLFAVGTKPQGGGGDIGPYIYRYNRDTLEWERETQVESPDKSLYGVYVVNKNLAYAVGESGTVLKWTGTEWRPVTGAGAPTGTLRSVLAFGESSVFVVSESGTIHRYDGEKWVNLSPGGAPTLYDIAGTRPDDIWVVGANNSVYHWPGPLSSP